MKKEDILKKNQEKNQVKDERDIHIDRFANSSATVFTILLIAGLVIFNAFNGVSSYSLMAVFWGTFTVEIFSKWLMKRENHFRVILSGITLMLTIYYLVSYITSVIH